MSNLDPFPQRTPLKGNAAFDPAHEKWFQQIPKLINNLSSGVAGPPGPPGAKGDAGATGPQGIPGASGPPAVLLNPGSAQAIVSGSLTVPQIFTPNLSNILFADQFAGSTVTDKLDAAIASLSTNYGVVVIPSNMGAGTPTTVPENVTLIDYRGHVQPPGNVPGIYVNTSSGAGGTAPKLLVLSSNSNLDRAHLAIFGIQQITGSIAAGTGPGGISGETQILGTLGTIDPTSAASAGEFATLIGSTGQTIPLVIGSQSYVVAIGGSTTNITRAVGEYIPAMSNAGSGVWAELDGILIKEQTAGAINYSLRAEGDSKFDKSVIAKRFKTSGTALVAGDFGLSGFGSGASVTVVSGDDSAGNITVTVGSGASANPTVTLTFHDGTWTNPPVVIACRTDSAISPTTLYWTVNAISATSVSFTLVGNPTGGNTYGLAWIASGL